MIIFSFILSAVAAAILYIVSIVVLYFSVVLMHAALHKAASRIEQCWSQLKSYAEKFWIRTKQMLFEILSRTKKATLNTVLFLYEKYSLCKVFAKRNKAELFILIKLLIVASLFVLGICFYISQQTLTWHYLLSCSHWLYFVIFTFAAICCNIIIWKKLIMIYRNESQMLQKGYQEISNPEIGWYEVWLRVIERNNNLLNSIWDTFMGLLLPCLLLIYGYSVVADKHIDFKDMLGVSMTIISVLLAIFSLAFARDVKRDSDEKTQVMMDKLSEILEMAPDEKRKEKIITLG